jgi:hypothetical protein
MMNEGNAMKIVLNVLGGLGFAALMYGFAFAIAMAD